MRKAALVLETEIRRWECIKILHNAKNNKKAPGGGPPCK